MNLFDINSDIWVMDSGDGLEDYSFRFDYLPNKWFKGILKEYTNDQLSLKRIKKSTLHRYNYNLIPFFEWAYENEIVLNTFRDVENNTIERFCLHLLNKIRSNSTRSIIFSSLKSVIKYGQLMEWDGFPERDIFSGEEFRILQTEDVLKTKSIPYNVMAQIDNALDHEEDVFDKCLISVARYSGGRLSELITLDVNCIERDLLNKPLLVVNDIKTLQNRFVPVDIKCEKAVKQLVEDAFYKELRESINSKKLFIKQKKLKR